MFAADPEVVFKIRQQKRIDANCEQAVGQPEAKFYFSFLSICGKREEFFLLSSVY